MSSQPQLPQSVLLIGGPDAGKSNFLFRLWRSVDEGEGALVKDGFPDELEYLRNGLESLLKGSFAGRTSKEVLEHVAIPVKSAIDPTLSGLLTVPDVPGERILRVYQTRQWDALWENRILEGCGCLIFIRAGSDEIVRPLDYAECLRLYGSPLKTVEEKVDPAARGCEPPKILPATPAASKPRETTTPREQRTDDRVSVQQEPPTDVVLTDWLQFLRRAFTDRVGGSYRPRVGIVMAAWDNVPHDQLSGPPADYLRANFPLLWQFMESNRDLFNFQVFGVSILGGDLKNDKDFREEFSRGRPDEFGYVVHTLQGKLEKVSDITMPVAWGLGWLETTTTPEIRR